MNEVERIFGMFDGLSEMIHLQDEVNRKQAQIRSVNERRCGNCGHWMKTSCAPEKQHKQFKSINSVACGAFALDAGSRRLNDQFAVELQELAGKLDAAKAKHLPTTGEPL
jgi:hypothetical protein